MVSSIRDVLKLAKGLDDEYRTELKKELEDDVPKWLKRRGHVVEWIDVVESDSQEAMLRADYYAILTETLKLDPERRNYHKRRSPISRM